MKLIPVGETLDLIYATKYKTLPLLSEVTDTILLHPDTHIAEAYRRKQTLREYLKSRYAADINLKIMMDHGIFISSAEFRQLFSAEKTPENILKIYNALGIDYGIAYDVPSRLHLQASIELALKKINAKADDRLIKSINSSVKENVESIADLLSQFLTRHDKNARERLQKLIRESSRLYKELRLLSEITVEESLKNLQQQLELKSKRKYSFLLIPVVQGLFIDDAMFALKQIIDLLGAYGEFYESKDTYYIAIGTSGTQLSSDSARMVNSLLRYGHEIARQNNISVKFHLLGVNSFDDIDVKLVYSADAVTSRRRAVDRRLYVINGKLKLVDIKDVRGNWFCDCPACSKFKDLVLVESSERKVDIPRVVHNLYTLMKYYNR